MTQSEFLEIVMPFKDKLYRLAKRLLISSEEAEDATQEVLLKLWSGKKKMATYKNVEAFAMTMTKNFCLDRLKSKQAGNLKLVHSNYANGETSLQRQVEVRDSLGWVEQIMDELPQHAEPGHGLRPAALRRAPRSASHATCRRIAVVLCVPPRSTADVRCAARQG